MDAHSSTQSSAGEAATGMWSDFFSLAPQKWIARINAASLPRADWTTLATHGGYPVPSLQLENETERSLWLTGYAQTYLERDIQDLGGIASLVDLRRLMRAVCLRLGNVINQTELARDIGMSQPTVHRHLDLLEASYQLVRVPAYAVNRTKRLIKSPKAYWTDTALALHLAGEKELRGSHFENVVLNDLLAWRGAGDGPEILYWRTTTGEEVDFVVEWQGKLLPIEIKTTSNPRLSDARHLQTFRDQYKKASLPGLLIHTGNETRWILDSVLSVPWWKIM